MICGSEIRLLFVFYSVRNITEKIKIKPSWHLHIQGQKKSTRLRCEICPKLIIKAPKRRQFCRSGVFTVNFVLCSFCIFTLNRWMPVVTCCIHFYIDRTSHPEVFFKKGILRIFRQFTGEHPCKSFVWVLLCNYATYQ